MRRLLTLTAISLLQCSVLVAQNAPQSSNENFREAVREKIRVDVNQLDKVPTVGEIREAMAKRRSDPKGFMLSGSDMLVSGDASAESEVHAAINPTDSNNIVVSPIRSSATGFICPIFYTKDFGQSWHESEFLSLPLEEGAQVMGGGDPVFAYDDDGTLYFTWISLYGNAANDSSFGGIFWASSDDGGETWTFDNDHAVVLDAVNQPPPFGFYQLAKFNDKQWMAVDRSHGEFHNRLYIAYVELQGTSGLGTIVVRNLHSKTDTVENISVPVSTDDYNMVQFSSIKVGDDGRVHVSFFGEHKEKGWGLWHSISTDGGASFSEATLVSSIRFGTQRFGGNDNEVITGIQADRLYPSPHIAIDNTDGEHSGTLYAVWTALGVEEDEGKGYDIYLSRLEGDEDPELGGGWSEPIIVNDDGLTGDQFYPSIAVSPDGVVVVSWYDKRQASEKDNAHYYMAYSFDGGKTFNRNIQVTSEATDFATVGNMNNGFGIGEYTQVVTSGSYAIPVWADGRSGNGNMDIYAAFFPISPEASSAPDRLASVETGLKVEEIQPNPVPGAKASLRFHLEHPGTLSVELVDAAGANVRMLVEGRPFESGEHNIEIDVDNLPAGTYFCRIHTERKFAVRKLVVE